MYFVCTCIVIKDLILRVCAYIHGSAAVAASSSSSPAPTNLNRDTDKRGNVRGRLIPGLTKQWVQNVWKIILPCLTGAMKKADADPWPGPPVRRSTSDGAMIQDTCTPA